VPAKGQTDKPCKFCQIVAGTEKSHKVFADEVSFAFLDYRPLAIGHVLLVPRTHYATPDDAPDAVMAELGKRLKLLSAAVVQAMQSEGSFIGLNNIVSQSVPHIHFHIVPRRRDDRLFSGNLIWRRVSYRDDAERAEVVDRIRKALP
jgi:histidine triad (HIT) family protein